MDINWLEDFVCLARTLNFTRAAEERNITQSAFSRRIKALEIWAGAPLIDRTSFPAKLSTAGEEFLPTAKTIVKQLLEARDDMRARDRGGLKFYAFAAPHSISITHLAPLLHKLQGALSIRSRVMSDNLHTCCQLVSEGVCDFLVCYRHPHIPITLDEQLFKRLDLGREHLIPITVPDALGDPKWLLPGDRKAPLPKLAYAKGSFLGAVVDHLLNNQRAALDVRHVDAFAEALKSLALEGQGIAWLPEQSVASSLAQGELVRAGTEQWDAPLTLSIYAAVDSLDPAGLKIWDFFSSLAKG
ncbi:LysR family transcriptional regulator [Pelagibius sp. Alg239-R121]|uniref:LysR family transcriptional regulator n=1 Tax=Pelagibius sp. Alg239-R121 TaxID=2993448 RepID=UPI0024A64455|nr:LysR family transcriptional regulator [Pelagibius sp. Alg239-R121]